jgi:predicted TIM-barrel fold metal-dependent hydrolase
MPFDLPMDRRTALQTLTAAAATLSASPVLSAAEDKGWIDAHSHIWTPDIERFPLAEGLTKKDLAPLSFTDDELMAIAGPEGVTRVVLIQHSVYHLFDNSYCIDAVRRHPKRFRVVGMIDDHQPKAAERMKELLEQGVTGFRITPFIRKENQDRWLETPGMNEMWKTAATTRQSMCCLIGAQELTGVDAMCEKYPDTPVVIDHFARIGVDGQMRDSDIANLCKLARRPLTKVKVSAFYALGKKQPPHLELAPMIKRLYETFGPKRLMWASDCPYQLGGGNTYRDSIALVRDKLDFLSDDDRTWLLRKTAEETFFYQ